MLGIYTVLTMRAVPVAVAHFAGAAGAVGAVDVGVADDVAARAARRAARRSDAGGAAVITTARAEPRSAPALDLIALVTDGRTMACS